MQTRDLRALIDAARTTPGLAAWRAEALDAIGTHLSFDFAVFHELSPRVPLERGAFIGVELSMLAGTRRQWDDNAVELGRIRDLALAQGGVATDAQAFPPRSRARRAWNERVATPLRIRTLMAAHLVVRARIISVILLGRRRGPAFSTAEQRTMTDLLPALAVGDALLQALEANTVHGPPTTLECVDQRLTPRQREVVVQVALGHTNAEIGNALGISEHTVRNLLAQVRTRLCAANRAEVVRLAVLR